MKELSFSFLEEALVQSYSKDLCYSKVGSLWKRENPYIGMCAITALTVQDYFGGDIAKIKVDGISHYFNFIQDQVVDFTVKQFSKVIFYHDYRIVDRKDILTEDTRKRYELLKKKVVTFLLQNVDKSVYKCALCHGLVEKFPNTNTVFLGSNNDIVLVGEAPANNGWRKSHMLWRDESGKKLPSGVVLQKLFDIIDKNILETTFLEAVKCYPLDRKHLKVCSLYCKEFMMAQLEILNPKLIITLGEFLTRTLLDVPFQRFSSVVGNVYEVGKYRVLPIYHPSPISPKSYKGNVPIFEKIKNELL